MPFTFGFKAGVAAAKGVVSAIDDALMPDSISVESLDLDNDQLHGLINDVRMAMEDIGVMYVAECIAIISKPSSVRRSLPGEPPRAETGDLRRSIFHEVRLQPGLIGWSDVVLLFGTTLDYGFYLEVGTGKMKPRPYLMRIVDENMDKAYALLGA